MNRREQLLLEAPDSKLGLNSFITDKESDTFKMLLEIKNRHPATSVEVKIVFCKLQKFHKKSSVMVSLFRETVNSHTCNCTKKVTITGVFFVVSFEFNFHFISRFFLKKTQINLRFYFIEYSF